MRQGRLLALAPLFFLSALSPAHSSAAPKQPSTGISISADSLVVDWKRHTAVYRGQVVARDPAHEVTILANQIEFRLDPQMDAVEHARATGRVRLAYGSEHGVADEVDYFPAEARLILIGRPEVWQNNDAVSGCRITLLLREDQSRVGSCTGDRVQAVFYPQPRHVS